LGMKPGCVSSRAQSLTIEQVAAVHLAQDE
jgi:hypothetical protein